VALRFYDFLVHGYLSRIACRPQWGRIPSCVRFVIALPLHPFKTPTKYNP